jgi:TolB-like protein
VHKRKLFMASVCSLFILSAGHAVSMVAKAPVDTPAPKSFDAMAEKLSARAVQKLSDKKVAVLPFEYVDGRKSAGGRVVAEELTNRIVELGDLTVIERGLVEKVMSELEFQMSGAVDPDTAKKIGKGLGVEAIITGTLEDLGDDRVEVNARVIKTESYEIIAAASGEVVKTWEKDGDASDAVEPPPERTKPAIH